MTDRPIIVFDIDGTLADTIHDLVAAMNRTIQMFGVLPLDAMQVAHLTGKGGLKAMIRHAYQLSGKPLEEAVLEEVFVACAEEYEQNIVIETKFYPGVRSSLK